MLLDSGWAFRWIQMAGVAVVNHRKELSDLDKLVGDGDHGDNLSRGFIAVGEAMDDANPQVMSEIFKITARTLMRRVGGAAGPLYGEIFMCAARTCGPERFDRSQLTEFFTQACAAMMNRGGSKPGEKTMLDAWYPARQFLQANEELEVSEALRGAVAAAQRGVEATVHLPARRGRASYLGQRTIGHMDPGARSSLLILHAAVEAMGDTK